MRLTCLSVISSPVSKPDELPLPCTQRNWRLADQGVPRKSSFFLHLLLPPAAQSAVWVAQAVPTPDGSVCTFFSPVSTTGRGRQHSATNEPSRTECAHPSWGRAGGIAVARRPSDTDACTRGRASWARLARPPDLHSSSVRSYGDQWIPYRRRSYRMISTS